MPSSSVSKDNNSVLTYIKIKKIFFLKRHTAGQCLRKNTQGRPSQTYKHTYAHNFLLK